MSIGGAWGSSRIALIGIGSMRILEVVGRGEGKVLSIKYDRFIVKSDAL